MLDKEAKSIDVVRFPRPITRTPPRAWSAMKAGKHTYIQKPLARTMGEVRVWGSTPAPTPSS